MPKRSYRQRKYVVNGTRVVLRADPAYYAVHDVGGPAPDPAAHAAVEALAPAVAGIRIPGENYRLVPVPAVPSAEAAHDVEVTAAAPHESGDGGTPRVFRLGRHHRVVATDRVLVRLREGAGSVQEVAGRVLEELLGPGGYVLEPQAERTTLVRFEGDADPFRVSARLRRLHRVEFAEPDLVTLFAPVPPGPPPGMEAPVPDAAGPGVPHAAVENVVAGDAAADRVAARQRALRQVRALEAHQRVGGGRREVVIAVLDAPVNRAHPDLEPALHAADAVLDVTPGARADADGHATACAGLAVAVVNDGIGLRGVGAGCALLPVRFAHVDPAAGVAGVSGSASAAARAVDAAWQNGAWVISLSWVFGFSGSLEAAIERARTQGRGGRGCVVVVGVGNDGGRVHFPAHLPGVLAVGACTAEDRPKTFLDKLGNWASCVGKAVSITAPGVSNFTTDVIGEEGLHRGARPDGDYLEHFHGTSSSTPIVAGAAALVLCANPCLREDAVRDILHRTSFKPEGIPFSPEGHHEGMGFGRLDALAAVEEALRMLESGEVPCLEKPV